ncbi:hypothetical protein B0A52_05726 [Exophiala mesophila]|uniref:Receptor L-domain domain-containing protein n=1 Tax=Exophiala mesophila TaxID=212818 RepID=A0A438N2C7_EXOME|nr:hypothetical protein B0A52_05726 [Exophiala mesophila]
MFHRLLSIIGTGSALLLAVHAQSTPSVCSNFTVIINSQDTLEAAQACTTVTGDIVIQYGPTLPPEIEFPILEQVDGSLLSLDVGENILAWRFSAPKLERVVNDFYLSRWVNLTTIEMPLFDHAERVRLNHLPKLTTAHFLSTVSRLDWNYEIRNTSLTNITNDRLLYSTFVEIFDNPNLETFEMLALRNASFNVALRRNRPGVAVRLRDLTEVWHLELQEISSLSVPALKNVIGYFTVNASSLSTLNVPNLETVGTWYDPHITITNNRGLTITNNQLLDSMSFPQLKDVRLDLSIRNNTSLEILDFPELERVAGNVALEGPFSHVAFPELNRVGGEFTIGVDTSPTICHPFVDLKNNGSIRGDLSCPDFSEPSQLDLDTDEMQEYIDDYLEWAAKGQTNTGPSIAIPAALTEIMVIVVCCSLLIRVW